MGSFFQNIRIFFYLLWRDLLVLRSRFWSIFIDNVVILVTVIILFGSLMPRMGMPKELIGPLFIGNMVMSFFQIGFSLSARLVNDITFNRFIDYQIGLPLSIGWLIATYIVNFIIETALVTLPILYFGMLLLGNKFIIVQTSWLAFITVYILSLILFATLFLFYSFAYNYHWFWPNIWTRRIEPLFAFSSVFIVWRKLYLLSPIWGIVFLLNPITYVTEGLRSTLIGGETFIPTWICILAILVGISINLFLLFPRIKKRLDLI